MTPQEQEHAISELEKELDRLQALYNQYFMGIERIEPTIPRKNLDRRISMLRRIRLNNTALRFRLQMQIQKYNTHTTYWRRICRQIEEGTYKRDIMRANRRKAIHNDPPTVQPATQKPAAEASSEPTPPKAPDKTARVPGKTARKPSKTAPSSLDPNRWDSFDLDDPFGGQARAQQNAAAKMDNLDDPFGAAPPAQPSQPGPPADSAPAPKNRAAASVGLTERKPARPAAEPKPAAQPRAAAPAKPQSPAGDRKSPALTEERLKSLYRTFLTAKKRCNEPVDKISYEKLAATLRSQHAKQNGQVDFKIAIRNGKTIIKTVKKPI